MHHGTPASKDKRFWLCAGTIASVLFMTWHGHSPGEQVLTFVGLSLSVFMGQSQYGQTKRACTNLAPPETQAPIEPQGEVRHG